MDEEQRSAGVPSQTQVIAHHYDGLAGLFTAILMQLQAASDLPLEKTGIRAECFLRAESIARQGLRQARELVEMSTLMDDRDEGALAAMRNLVDAASRKTSTACTFDIKGREYPLKSSTGITLQRILQEALTNAQRYADAKEIAVLICFEDDRVVLEVKDDGCGFVPDESLANGFGLMRMRARVDRLAGGLWLRSAPGMGTHIRVDLPNACPEG